MKSEYQIENDVNCLLETSNISEEEFCTKAGLSRRTLHYAYGGKCTIDSLEKVYSAIYSLGIRLNLAKTEIYLEQKLEAETILFHGSKGGIEKLSATGARDNCDFGTGFYCSEFYSSALAFIENYKASSVYLFSADLHSLSSVTIPPSLEWMIIVCYHRGMIKEYDGHPYLKSCLEMIKGKDLIIAPIADNRMFQIMRDFGEGNITDQQAIHALSASSLGNQYVFKSEEALSRLKLLERLYASEPERQDSIAKAMDRKSLIDTKLKMAKREFRSEGKFIDEVFA